MRWSPRCAPCANRSSTARSRTSPSGASCCACLRSRGAYMQIQPQLMLLQKTLLNVEGLGRELYPELDIWSTASPILREWMRERTSVRALVHELSTSVPELIAAARGLPALLQRLAQRPPGVARTQTPGAQLSELLEELRAARRRDTITLGLAYLGGGLFWLAVSRGRWWPRGARLAAGIRILAYGLGRKA